MSWLVYWITVAALAVTFTAAILTLVMKNTKLERQIEADQVEAKAYKEMVENQRRDIRALQKGIEEWKKKAEQGSPFESLVVRQRTGCVRRFALKKYISRWEIEAANVGLIDQMKMLIIRELTQDLRQIVRVRSTEEPDGSMVIHGEIDVVIPED